MNERILRVMEYNKILNQLQSQAETSLGKELALSLKPRTEREKVVMMQQETDEAVQVERLNASVPFGGISDIRSSVKRSVIGGVLNTDECLNIADTIYGGRRVKDFFYKIDAAIPILIELAGQLTSLRELEQHIKSCIDDNGHVMDSASERLRSLRSSIRTNESKIRDKLDELTKTKSNMLSDTVVTIRNERYVLPVKQAYRSSVGGIVHDQSASGQTLFMEPKPVEDLNNELQEAKAKEKQEIERILRELSGQIAEDESYLLANTGVLAKIDFMFARAKLGIQMKASMPQINNHGVIKMQQARHPLIPADEVVANDIEIGASYTSIVITGPNTGGKTVALKMVGLCTLMAQSGLQIPAQDGCELAIFEHVFADIGDEQSIEQSLSTFSSHMTNIVSIMEQVDDQTLVLLDELGAGTDPQEGAALAMAILDDVISRGARVIATTHYPELKAYGFNRDQVMNASVEFNIETLEPTYRLLLGIPGRSNAFEISSRLGLSNSIIDNAKELVGVDSKSVENMIASLEDSQIKAEQDYESAHQTLLDAEELKQELQKEWQQFQDKREKLYQKAEEKANKAVQKAREEAELIIEEVRSMKDGANVKEHEWIEAKKMLDEAKPELSSHSSERGQASQSQDTKKELEPGDHIKLLSVGQQGTILEKESDQEYLVQIGMMKVKVKRNDLHFLGKQKQADKEQVTTVRGSNHHVKPELDLRGERYEDAMLQLEKYLDDALLAGYPKVSIIHGKGTGALRSGVNGFAKNHSRIKNSRPGGEKEGGSGVTVMELK